ncbi:MAG: amidohydrolase family protein [Rhodospirillales bacterium]|nr:amidohydrolase family protein [Rhodospirillales bacterium]
MPDISAANYDVVIRGGRVLDGTGLPSFIGDVAIKDGRIAETGHVRGKGRQEVDAQGLIVAPGVIDVHTHYDAQLNWDPYASQSCWHGVTSVVVSLCGFGFAPCRPEDRERAMRRMTRVEAIPYESMELGMRWDWVSQRDYFDSLESHGIGVNVAAYIPHSAVRAYVMGEEDKTRAQATPDEMAQMKDLIRDGYRAGALGLSTDLNLIDRDFDGGLLPSAVADDGELLELLSVAKEYNVGSSEVTPYNIHLGEKDHALLERYFEASGRPVIYSVIIQSNHLPDKWKDTLQRLERSNANGSRIYAVSLMHRLGSLFSLLEYNLFDDMPAWNTALACPLEQRLKNLQDPDVRKKLQHDIDHHLERVWSGRWDRLRVRESTQKEYEGRTVAEIATAEGKEPVDAFCDINIAEGLKTLFYVEDQLGDDEQANAEISKSNYVLPGTSDGGAHTQFISMGKYPTVILSKLVRDDKVMSLEEAHRRLSYMSAAAIGLEGIGTLERGAPADIIVYDLDALKVTPDAPVYEEILGGGKRLIEKAEGYRYTFVNGEMTFKDGDCTGALPGRVLRTAAYEPEAQKVAAS